MIAVDLVLSIVGIAFTIVFFTLSVRRLHDVGLSGWWVLLIWLAPFFITAVTLPFSIDLLLTTDLSDDAFLRWGPVALMAVAALFYLVEIVICLLPGQPRANTYGPNPQEVSP